MHCILIKGGVLIFRGVLVDGVTLHSSLNTSVR